MSSHTEPSLIKKDKEGKIKKWKRRLSGHIRKSSMLCLVKGLHKSSIILATVCRDIECCLNIIVSFVARQW